MTLTETLLGQLENPGLSRDERAMIRCQIAGDLEHRGQYTTASEILGELWQGAGRRPLLEGLNERTAAEVLLRVGTLSGCLGSAAQDAQIQAAAKDLISESAARFEGLNEPKKAAIARGDLAICYWREGAYDEARVLITDALRSFGASEEEQRAKNLIRLTLVEISSGRYHDALRVLMDNASFFEGGSNEALKGRFHGQLALVLKNIGITERRQDYIDRAIIEYTAAIFHFEQSGNTRYRAIDENNLGSLLYRIGRYEEAHEHLNAARLLFAAVKDRGRIAQVDETRACLLLAQGRAKEAERAIRAAVRVLSKGGEQGLIAEALTTLGRVLSKRGNFPESRNTLRRAADQAEQAGAVEDAGRALLTLIEEHAESITEYELLESYERANSLLRETQDAETIERLRACAKRIVSARREALPPQQGHNLSDFWANFNLSESVRAFEARYIRRALIAAQGSITRAVKLLGLKHHATLAAMLEERHKDLAHLRTPPEPRRRSIMSGRRRRKSSKTRPVNILHVEDDPRIARAVKVALDEMAWTVETCADGVQAVQKIESQECFDLLILDDELGPGMGGLELVRRARRLAHRRRTPIIMLSASDVEAQAWRAGVDAYLKKPRDVDKVASMVARLLGKR